MEVARRSDVGTDLKAPVAARGGGRTPGYALVAAVQPGDIILHYDGRHEAIVGASQVSGDAQSAALLWVARGTSARRAGEKPRWLAGTRVPLQRFVPIEPPLTLAQVRQRQEDILRIRDEVEAQALGRPLYFPWVPYRAGPIRTFQSYLVKMPRAVVDLFPDLQRVVNKVASQPAPSFPDPVAPLVDAVASAAGRTALCASGQGYRTEQELRAAVEAHSMNAAIEYYSRDWEVEDVHTRESFDLICRNGRATMHVEVKGTTTEGAHVILTPHEVSHAHSDLSVALFVLSGIQLSFDADGGVVATGGRPRIFDPWHIQDGTLEPIGYRYTLPPGRTASD
jgi:hypothetical protein